MKKTKIITFLLTLTLTFTSIVTFSSSAAIGDRDPNGDGDIDLGDGILIEQYLKGAATVSNLDALDFDENGIISLMDKRKLQWHQLGLNVVIGNASQSGITTIVPASVPVSYRVYDAKTGNHISSKDYTLQPPSINVDNNVVSPNSVIDSDDRVIDWSKSGVVKLMCNNSAGYLGTGFVVGPHTIATAGHCVYNSVQASNVISEIMLFNNNGTTAMSATPVEIYIPTNYSSSSSTDYAMITVKEDLSRYACFNLSAALDYSSKVPIGLSISGFPQEVRGVTVNDGTSHREYLSTGSLKGSTSGMLTYNLDSSPGNSGGPVYVTENENGETVHSVIAIHTTGAGTSNRGARVTEEILRFFYHNPYISY